MGYLANYYLNTNAFGTATAVYEDEALTVLAPDGFYSVGGIVREQVGGVLQEVEPCLNCGNSCPTAPSATSFNSKGIYYTDVFLNTTTGAVVVEIEYGGTLPIPGPQGFRVIYDSQVYNTVYSDFDGRHEITAIYSPIWIGDGGTGCATNLVPNSPYADAPEYEYQQPLYYANGLRDCITVAENATSFTDPWPAATTVKYYMIIPKTSATPVNFSLEVYVHAFCPDAPAIRINCPTKLPSFQASKKNAPCGSLPTISLHHYPVANPTTPGVPGLHDPVYLNANATEHPPDGQYIYDDGGNGVILSIEDGVVVSTASCASWVGLLDVAPPATGAWSTRRLSASGAGRIMTVRRTTNGGIGDGDTAVVYYDPATQFMSLTGSPVTIPSSSSSNATTLEQFVGFGGNPDGVTAADVKLYVEEWWDQSGSENHFTALDPSLEPMVYDFFNDGFNLKTVNGNPAVLFEDNAKLGPIDFNYPQPYTLSFVGKYDDATTVAQSNFFGSRTATSGTNDIVGFALRSSQWDMIAPFNGFSGVADTNQHQWVMVFDGVEYMVGGANGELIPSGSYLRTDTVQETTNPGEIEIKNLSIGSFGVENASSETRYIQELVFWNGDQTDAVADIENITNSDFNIY